MKSKIKKMIHAMIIVCLFTLYLTPSFAKREIILATVEHEPYIGKRLLNYGYVHELVVKVFNKAGYTVKVKFFPLIRANLLVQRGTVDGIIPTYYDNSLKNELAYSSPFSGDNIGLLKKKSLKIKYTNKLNENKKDIYNTFKQYKFGLVRGNNKIPIMEDNNIFYKEFVKNNLQNIDKLSLNRVDFVVIDKYTASDIMIKQRPHLIGTLEFLKPPLVSNNFHLALSKKTKNYQKILDDFNKELEFTIKDGTLRKILSKHGLYQSEVKQNKKIKLVIGSVHNKDMMIMKHLSKEYKRTHPNINFEWKIMDENILRKRLLSDMAISDGKFDIMTIGSFETRIWAKRNWLIPITKFPSYYELNDLLKPVKNALSYKEKLYSLPFYGETSMTYYRKDLFRKAGIKMPEIPTYEEIKSFASKIHDPKNNIYGICLRGQAGWGSNLAYFNTLVNTFGGKWFDKNLNTTIFTPEWENALNFYKELVLKFGPPSTASNNFNENLKLFSNGHCGIWIDATVAASILFDEKESKVFNKVGFVHAPISKLKKGSNWLWIWSLAIPSSSTKQKAALDFITWATSKEYIDLVAKHYGWISVPPGTRLSTYTNKHYQEIAPFSNFILSLIQDIDINNNFNHYKIPEYQSIGDKVGKEIQNVIEEKISVIEALKKSQELVSEQMFQSAYQKNIKEKDYK